MSEQEFERFAVGSEWHNDGSSGFYVWCKECSDEAFVEDDAEIEIAALFSIMRTHNETKHS